jgi:hypothetical protein
MKFQQSSSEYVKEVVSYVEVGEWGTFWSHTKTWEEKTIFMWKSAETILCKRI